MVHTSNNNVRKVARDIVMAFAHHIKDRIKSKDDEYLQLGVDDDFAIYSELFRSVAGKAIGVNTRVVKIFPHVVTLDTLNIIEDVIKDKGYNTFLENKMLADCVFEVCLYILKKVKEEEFDDELAESM